MITIDNVQYRNLEEQVKKNMDDIKYILEEEGVLNEFGIKVVGQISTSTQLPDPDTYEGEYGDAYAVGTTAPYTFYIYTRANGGVGEPYWFNIGQFPVPSTIPGPTGPQGVPGKDGQRGSLWTNGRGVPTSESGVQKDDKYVNILNGDIFNYTGATWVQIGNIIGPQGIQGPQGNVGPAGPQGIQGPQGEIGPAGPAFVIAGTLANEGQLPNPSTLADNIAYLVGNDTQGYDLYVQLQDTQSWKNVGKVEGVQGPTGPQGPQGPQGPAGTIDYSEVYSREEADYTFLKSYGDPEVQGSLGINTINAINTGLLVRTSNGGTQRARISSTGYEVESVANDDSTKYGQEEITINADSTTYTLNLPNENGTLATTENVTSQLSTKQDKLVSGTNIKTVNGNSLLGSGDLTISAPKIYYCTFSDKPTVHTGFYIVLNSSETVPTTVKQLYKCFGQKLVYIPAGGTYVNSPITHIFYNGESRTGDLGYFDSSNKLQLVGITNWPITCTELPNN